MCKECGFESAGGKHIRLSRAERRREEYDDEDDPWVGECYPGAGIRIRGGDESEKPVGHFEANRFPDKREVDEALKTVRMEKQQDKKAGAYSLGMKQRLGLAAALLGKPKILLLDEPTNGLDPAGIQEMRELIRSLPERYGMTVMVSSHLLSEIDQMATHTGIIHKGELIFQDSLEHLHEHSRKRLLLKTGHNEAALRILGELGCRGKMMEDRISLPDMGDEKVAFCIAALVRQDIGVLRVEEYQRNLEDIFLGLTGKQVSL